MKIVTVVGARPQFVKCAMVSRELRKVATEILVHTGQHYDNNMSAVFFDELSIPEPDYHLGIGSGTHAYQTGEMLKSIERVLLDERADFVLVYGDTNSTLAGALAAAKLNISIGHVESGLRSFDRSMPEEINRIVTDHLSTSLFTPTQTAGDNLTAEGISDGVHFTGDVICPIGPNIDLIDPLSYLEMLSLEATAAVIATDSGGVQKEAYLLSVPCVTLRAETEWIETVEAGWNILVGTASDKIVEALATFRPQEEQPEYFGDGAAAAKIVKHVLNHSITGA